MDVSGIFTQEQLIHEARRLGALSTSSTTEGSSADALLARLSSCAADLEQAYEYLSDFARDDTATVVAEDWLRDNYHVVEDQIREIQQDLPRKYSLELPRIADGAHVGLPRVYALARQLIGRTAGRLDLETLTEFVDAYQEGTPLLIGEIWAVPIMLRLALVEELRDLVAGIVDARRSRERARRWVARRGRRAEPLEPLLRDESSDRLSPAFVAELLQWLRDQPPTEAPIWATLQRAIDAQHTSLEDLLRLEHQRDASAQVAMGNVISSMRLLSAADWPAFFERVSVVERILRNEPAGAYARMDFPTRDRYRHSVEQLARRSHHSERDVAERAVELAQIAHKAEPNRPRRHHVGYYLISRGRFVLEADLEYRPRIREHLGRFFFRHPAIGYLGLIALTTTLGVLSLMAYGARRDASNLELVLIAALSLLPVSELAISLVNALLTAQIPPRRLPKLSMRGGIPAEDRTLVAVPAIIDSPGHLETLLHDLEVRFLGNRDDCLHFVLLADFADAIEPETQK